MAAIRILTLIVALLLGGSEIARWWGSPRFVPMALDELIVAAAMLLAVAAPRRLGPAPLAAAWGLFNGLILSLLVPTLDHLLHGPDKDSAVFYAVLLGPLQLIGLWALWRVIPRRSRAR